MVLYTNIIFAVIILLIALAIGKLFLVLTKRVIRYFLSQTETDLDDRLMRAIALPIYAVIVWVGIFLSLSISNIRVEPHNVVDIVEQTGYIVAGIWLVLRVINAIFAWLIAKDRREGDTRELTALLIARRGISAILYILAFLVALDQLGIAITPLLASLGVGGLAVALALQDTLANYFSGVYVASDKSISVGDFVEVDGMIDGVVHEIGWRRTTILDRDENLIIVPNKKLSESTIINYNYPDPSLRVRVDFSVAYDSNLDTVKKVAIAAAKKIQRTYKKAVSNTEPIVRFSKLDESGVNGYVLVNVKDQSSRFQLGSDFIQILHKEFVAANISFAFPSRSIYFENPLISKKK